ncbi:MAG: zinc ribbon domain-containing protein [Candidatus Desulforudis sp.]|nr:zinc ribbon domain-containing protein [Desulforudis sp.]
MPVYDFKCQGCGRRFTVLVSLSGRDKLVCPKCKSENIRQTISPFSLFGRRSSRDACGSGGLGGG